MNPTYTKEQIAQILKLRRTGMSLRAIAAELGMSHSNVAHWVGRFRDEDLLDEAPRERRHDIHEIARLAD